MKKIIEPCGLHCIKMNHLGVTIGNQTILEDVNMHIHCGTLNAVIGRNGAGKTTLIRAILNDIPHEGSIDFRDTENGHMRRMKIGYVPQSLNIEKRTPLSVYDLMASYQGKAPVFLYKKKRLYEEIQEARSCDLDLAEIGAVQHSGFNYHLRDSAGIAFQRLRGHQRGVRGEIAVAVVSRDSHLKRRQRLCGEFSLADEPAERAHDYFLDLCLCFFYCVVHSVVLLLVVVGFYVYRYLIFEHKSRVDVYRIADVKLAAVGGHAVPHIYRGNAYHAVAVLRAVLAEMALSVLEHKARKRLAGAGHGDGVVLLAYAELHVASCVAGGFTLVVVDEEAAAVLPEFPACEQLGAVRAAVRGLL